MYRTVEMEKNGHHLIEDFNISMKTDVNGSDLRSSVISGENCDDSNTPYFNEGESQKNSSSTSQGCSLVSKFFSMRNGLFEQALEDSIENILRPVGDTDILGSWLLTEISHWDHERERLFILTTKTLLVVKYDYIAQKILDFNEIHLKNVDTILKGELKYPDSSFVPKLGGLANGVASIISRNIFSKTESQNTTSKDKSLLTKFDFSAFKPVIRNKIGIRIMWNKGKSLPLLTSWNPLTKDIPWITITDHPLFGHEDNCKFEQKRLSIENLYIWLQQIIPEDSEIRFKANCDFLSTPIIMQNYLGVGAFIHNRNNFGFFKVRGKWSF